MKASSYFYNKEDLVATILLRVLMFLTLVLLVLTLIGGIIVLHTFSRHTSQNVSSSSSSSYMYTTVVPTIPAVSSSDE